MAVLLEPAKERRFVLGPVCTTPYPSHLHDVVEIVILRKGHLNMTVNNSLYTLEPDTIMMVFPGMIHSYESASEDAEGLFVGFTPALIDEFHNLLISRWPVVPIQKSRDGGKDLENTIQWLEEHSGERNPHPLTQAYIHLLVASLLMNMELVPSAELNKDNLMYRIMYYIQEHSDENLTLDTVAKEMGIGRSHLSHILSQKLHIRFRPFLNTIRIEKACVMLQDPTLSVKEVCFRCGFENTRTFHRAFMEEQKMTPGEYRERMAHGWVTNPQNTVKH